MSAVRPFAALSRAVAGSSRSPLLARSIITNAGGAKADGANASSSSTGSSASGRANFSGAQGGIDPRVLQGVKGFVGAEQMARVDEWQAGLWTRLQDEVRSNHALAPIRIKWDNDRLDITELLAFTSREPELALAFNYASLLVNNSYFLEGLNAEAPKPIPEHFKHLEDRVSAYADGTVGSAWVWLVKSGDGFADIDVIPTFGAGTLLVTRRQQRGRQDKLPVFGTPKSAGGKAKKASVASSAPADPETPAAARPRFTTVKPRADAEPTPLAVLNLFEHAYLGDKYNVLSRGEYARDWFRTLDWDKVIKRSASAGSW